jgi:hypothetical protein
MAAERADMSAQPPSWAQSLLALIVAPRNRDGIVGDLLEEYREVQVPQRGQDGADAWYVRQVLLFLWRAARWWGFASGCVIVVRGTFDIYLPTDDYYIRSVWTTYGAISIYVACGFGAGWYYRRVLSGTVIGITAAGIASVIGFLPALLFLGGLGDEENAYTGLSQALDVPVPILLVLGAVLGGVGAAIGAATAYGNSPRRA